MSVRAAAAAAAAASTSDDGVVGEGANADGGDIPSPLLTVCLGGTDVSGPQSVGGGGGGKGGKKAAASGPVSNGVPSAPTGPAGKNGAYVGNKFVLFDSAAEARKRPSHAVCMKNLRRRAPGIDLATGSKALGSHWLWRATPGICASATRNASSELQSTFDGGSDTAFVPSGEWGEGGTPGLAGAASTMGGDSAGAASTQHSESSKYLQGILAFVHAPKKDNSDRVFRGLPAEPEPPVAVAATSVAAAVSGTAGDCVGDSECVEPTRRSPSPASTAVGKQPQPGSPLRHVAMSSSAPTSPALAVDTSVNPPPVTLFSDDPILHVVSVARDHVEKSNSGRSLHSVATRV